MASMLIGSAVGAASAARVTAVRPRAGAGARAYAFGANNAASPSRVASLGRRGTVRVAVRASLGAETVREEKPEARVVPEDAPASASHGEALKQVQTRPSSGCHHGENIANLARVRAFPRSWRVDSLTVRHPRLPPFHAVRTSRRARRRCHGPRAGFPLRLPSRGEGEERGRGGGPDSLSAVHAQPDPEGGEPRVAPRVVLDGVAAEVETHENHHARGGGGVLAAVRHFGVRVVLRVRALAGLENLDHRGGRDESVLRLHRGVSGVGALHRVRPVHRSVFSAGQRARRDPAPRRRAVHPRVHVLRAGGAVDVRLGEEDI
mmetsp:Transcript_10774/g.45869  ORF Transcript_10774/g.45869 Transcript_10774/m.45869 type:complete len:319 (+) Transcript_10774:1099-2055(+)